MSLLSLLACARVVTETVVETVYLMPDTAHEEEELLFEGLQRLSWEEGSLLAEWPEAVGEEPLSYELIVRQDEELLRLAAGEQTELALSALADGEYHFRVEAIDAHGERNDGGVELTAVFGDNRLAYRGELPLHGAADVWGEGDTVVLAGRDGGVSFLVVDISDPTQPQLLKTVTDAGYVKDIKIGDGLMFTNGECGCRSDSPEWQEYDRIGARIWDWSQPSEPVLLGQIGGDEHPSHSVHNLSYEDGVLYLTDNLSDGVGIYDVSDPTTPVLLTEWIPPLGGVHDQVMLDGLLYEAFWAGFAVLDVTDPANPIELHMVIRQDPSALHNIWPSKDHRYVFTTDEMPGGHVRIHDLQAEGAPQVGMFQPDEDHVVHNVHIREDFAFVSSYIDGVHVLDVRDPTHPELVGWYDTFDEHDHQEPEDTGSEGEHEHPGQLYAGAWGIWPYGEHLAVGDMQRGLILLDHVPEVVEAE